MNFIKKLFKKQQDHELFNIQFPFEISVIKYHEVYLSKLLNILENEGDIEYLRTEGRFDLIFGTKDTTHIIYYLYSDVLIMFEPEKDGWTATRVYIDYTENQNKTNLAYKNMTFLFKIPNILFGEKPYIDDDVNYTYPQYASVYAEIG